MFFDYFSAFWSQKFQKLKKLQKKLLFRILFFVFLVIFLQTLFCNLLSFFYCRIYLILSCSAPFYLITSGKDYGRNICATFTVFGYPCGTLFFSCPSSLSFRFKDQRTLARNFQMLILIFIKSSWKNFNHKKTSFSFLEMFFFVPLSILSSLELMFATSAASNFLNLVLAVSRVTQSSASPLCKN